MRLKTYKMAIFILPKFLTLKWNISRQLRGYTVERNCFSVKFIDDFNAGMILEMTNYLLDYFVSSYSISIIRSPSSACFSSSVALIFTSSLKVHHRPIHQALMKNLILALDQGLRAKGCVLRSQALAAAGRMLIFIQD